MIAVGAGGNGIWRPILVLVVAFASGAANGQSVFLPYASTQYEYNNNVFALPNSTAALAASGDSRLGDSDLRAVAGIDESYLLGRQRFYATVEGRYIDYEHFGYLSHAEYLAKLGLDWKLSNIFDGTLLDSIEQVMAPFADRNTQTQLALNLDRHSIAKLNVRIAPEWRLETAVDYHDLSSPIQNYPDYGLTETTSHVALKYLGVAQFTYGLSADYLDGKFRNAPVPGSYTQSNIDLTMTYQATGLSSFNATVGHTQRDQGQGQGNISEATGELGYTRRLGGKTSIHLDYLRAVNSYIGAGGSELDSAISASINYQWTFKTGVSFGYQHTTSDFLGQTIPGSDALGRKDTTQGAWLRINYQALRWLLIQPYVNYQRRVSDVELFGFTGTTVGIQLLAKRPAPPQR